VTYVKIVVSAPLTHADAVRKALGDAGAGRVGNYSHCSFTTRGVGRFVPLEGAEPHIGTIGEPAVVEEERIEVVCESTVVRAAIESMLSVHPYEDSMYELYALVQLDDL
jgi:hypothetical protein